MEQERARVSWWIGTIAVISLGGLAASALGLRSISLGLHAACLVGAALTFFAARGVRGVAGSAPAAHPSNERRVAFPSLAASVPCFGAYQLLELLGGGSMGELWRAKHTALGRTVALKRIKAASVSAEDVARFQREARATSELRSPHTVEVYDFGEASGTLFYAMECLDGIDLQSLVERDGPLPPARAIAVLLQACHSLADAHAQGLVHRDIKPANLMLCRYGLDLDFVKLLDFGLAKATQKDTTEAMLTRRGVVLGTAAYLAPESLKGSSYVDARADLYALGAVAFWLLTGRLLFPYTQPMEMVRAHIGEEPPLASTFAPSPLPAELDAAIAACLQKDPAARPQSASELAERLGSIAVSPGWSKLDAREWWGREAS